MCIEAYVEWQLPFHFSDHWFNPDRATAGHGAALSACLSPKHTASASVSVCVCVYVNICVCVHVTGWHKVNIGVRFSAFACVKTSLFFFSFSACAKCVFFFWECTRAQGRVRRAGRMCCTGWLQWQANAAFNEGGGERRGKHRKLNWYVNDGNSHLSWRLRVLQH